MTMLSPPYPENPSPQEAERIPPFDLATQLFRRNWPLRHDRDRYWRRLHRHWARQAVGDLRYLTNRPRKGNPPWHYGQIVSGFAPVS